MKTSRRENCIFGPIVSRRLGLSLGVDLLPFKTCSMDCIYCECGKTTDLTLERKEYFPTSEAIKQIDAALAKHPHADYVTFSGVGEPTLHSGIGAIVRHVKEHYPKIKLCLLTNSTTMTDPAFRMEMKDVDLIIPSLDGSTQEELEKINRPASGVVLGDIADALAMLKKIMTGRMWLEIFAASGINDSRASAERFRTLVEKIRPDKVQLNTLDRPGTEKNVGIPPLEMLEMMRSVISSAAPVEIVGKHIGEAHPEAKLDIAEYNADIINTLRSRPCTAADIAETLKFDGGLVSAHLRRMEKAGLLKSSDGPRGTYYSAE